VISGSTQLLAIIGDPLAQARTPELANAVLARRGIDAVLMPVEVGPDGLATVVDGFRAVRNFRGAVVTMPHKERMLPLADTVSATAAAAGACNVIRREPDGAIAAEMLDGEAVVAALAAAGTPVAGRAAYLAGAGGAASGIALALAGHGVRAIRVRNRTAARAEQLVARLRAAHPDVDVAVTAQPPAGEDIVVNATSVGMDPSDPLPFPLSQLRGRPAVVEMAVRQVTALAEAATRAGCRVTSGAAVLAAQIGLMTDFMLGGTAASGSGTTF
jgi:shikimate dehydrogenase